MSKREKISSHKFELVLRKQTFRKNLKILLLFKSKIWVEESKMEVNDMEKLKEKLQEDGFLVSKFVLTNMLL